MKTQLESTGQDEAVSSLHLQQLSLNHLLQLVEDLKEGTTTLQLHLLQDPCRMLCARILDFQPDYKLPFGGCDWYLTVIKEGDEEEEKRPEDVFLVDLTLRGDIKFRY